MSETRFPMRLDPWWRPFLLVGAAVRENSYLELTDDTLIARFGRLFEHTIPREEIDGAKEADWPLWMGVGWRTGFGGRFGLIGSYQGIVEIRLREPVRVWRVLNCTRLAVSLEEPEAFLEALESSS